ncbi:22700_t:CDS:2 [Gigaspora margarita]|uniref:22700_t:CDS:1 n=1 Tax=Gigaspora margarita TaxID=4874 RepID=A0ABM8W0C5_GIGMA|nr:22700_t:CDS:2 [Gigaspora margarita]
MILQHNLAKNLLLSIILLYSFTANGYDIIYSSSKNDLQNMNFDVNSSYDGGLVIKIFDDYNNNSYKAIQTLLPNGSAIYIDLKFTDKSINVSRIFPLTMRLYFLFYDDIVDGNKQVTGMLIDWNNHVIKEQYDINFETKDSFTLSINSTLQSVFSMVDGSFGFVTSEVSFDVYNLLNTSIPTIYLHYNFLSFSTFNISEKFLLYSAKYVNNLIYISCSSSYSEDGNVCIMTLGETFTKSIVTTYQIDFLSSGSVIKLNIRYMNINLESYYILPLFYGGSIITSWTNDENKITGYIGEGNFSNLSGHIIPLNSNEYEWGLNLIPNFSRAMFDTMKNNTYILYVVYDLNSWDIFSINVEKFRNDFGYENPNVISTYPNINDTISPRISSISITFSSQISRSLNKLSIYQINTTTKQSMLRQFYYGNSENCTILNNTILCNISSSIINRWDSSYVIVVDNNFVKFASTGEPIYGIAENIWTLNTISQTKPEEYSGSATVIVRLTYDGTDAYNSLTQLEKSKFLNSLLNELIESIPTTPERLHLTNRMQYDPSKSPSQYLLQIEISAPTNHYQTSVSQIINDMNSLIINKDTSVISINNHTKYLDSSYGVALNVNFWDEIKFKLLELSIGCAILIIIALMAHYIYPKGQSFMIFTMAFIIFDSVMDILFIVENGNDVPSLYLPSIIIFGFAVLFNFAAAIILISYELYSNNLFSKWVDKYANIIPIFVILSGSNVMLLNCLTSNFGGFELFNAPFLNSTRNWIFWGSIFKTITENIPQFVIQLISPILRRKRGDLNLLNNNWLAIEQNNLASHIEQNNLVE